MKTSSYCLFLSLLAVLALFPLAAPFSSSIDSNQQIVQTVPREIGSWKGQDIPLDERTYEILETRNVLSRQYVSPRGEKVELLIVSSNKDRRVAHPPEVCYITSNFSIVDERIEKFTFGNTSINLKRFTAQDKNSLNREKVMYVYKVGNRYTANYFAQQLLFAWDLATRRESQILLIRLSGSEENTFKAFLPQLLIQLSSS